MAENVVMFEYRDTKYVNDEPPEHLDALEPRIRRFEIDNHLPRPVVIRNVGPFSLRGRLMARSIGFATFAACLAFGISMAQSKNEPLRVSVSDIGKSMDLIGHLGNPLGEKWM